MSLFNRPNGIADDEIIESTIPPADLTKKWLDHNFDPPIFKVYSVNQNSWIAIAGGTSGGGSSQTLYKGNNPPLNTNLLWQDTSINPNVLKVYNTNTLLWENIVVQSQQVGTYFHFESLANIRNSIVREFTIPYYNTGVSELQVFLDGILVSKEDYTETNNYKITFMYDILTSVSVYIHKNSATIHIIDCGEF